LRSFIAFKPPEVITRQIDRLQAQLRAEGVDARWVKPSNVHLTLKFLGETDAAKAGDIRVAMQAAVSDQAPLELVLAGLGGFPNLSRPRVIWQALAADVERLQAIQQVLEDRLVPCGFPRARRPFRAHLTIGRMRHPRPWRPAAAAAVKRMQDLPPQPFTVDALIWYQSRLLPGGAEYTVLARAPLAASLPSATR
jgi:2'-5' RNA ligase